MVRVSLTESSPDRDSARSSMLRGPVPTGAHLITVMRHSEMSVFTPLNFADAASVTEFFRNEFVYNNNPEPVVTHPVWRDKRYSSPYEGYFFIGKNAFLQGRVNIAINSDISSAHKSCNLCDDYSSRIKMRAPERELLLIKNFYPGSDNIDTTAKQIILGPYQATGKRDGAAITATAGTVKEFKVYFSIKLDEGN